MLIPRFWGLGGGGYSPYPLPGDLPDNPPGYWFAADHEAFSDGVGTLCAGGDRIQQWNNQGSKAENGTQATEARRPYFREGGAGGRPYIECDAASQHYFDDLALRTAASGLSSNRWKMGLVVARIANIGNGVNKPIMVGPDTAKGMMLVRPSGDIRACKSGYFSNDTPFADGNVHAVAYYADQTGFRWMADDGVPHFVGDASNFQSTALGTSGFLRTTYAALGGPCYFDGDLYEVINWENPGSDLSSVTEEAYLTDLIAYAVAKYAL